MYCSRQGNEAMELRIGFLGFGNVARAFARIISEREARIADQFDLRLKTNAIATGAHGCIVSAEGFDLKKARAAGERGAALNTLPAAVDAVDTTGLVAMCDADVLFETTPLNPIDGEPATEWIRKALLRRMSVVTANKGPIAFAHKELTTLAREVKCSFRFEATVMDGAPIFNMVESCLPAVRVTGLAGVLNSTTNYILTGMERGRLFEECLTEARELGVAEANADYDIDGWDAAVKIVALANVLMNADATPRSVERRGIRYITSKELKHASDTGALIRLVARAEMLPSGLKLAVGPEAVAISSILGSARGTTNALILETDLMGELAVIETNPGVEQTAYALLSDLIAIHRELQLKKA